MKPSTNVMPLRQPRGGVAGAMPSRQRGVVLLFAMICLVVMLIGSVALMRSMNSSMFAAGNIAFKRDMQSQSERAVDAVLTNFRTGGAMNTTGQRANTTPSSNYSAQILPVNNQGIPKVLGTDGFVDPDTSVTVGQASNDIAIAGAGITVRYVVDRQCSVTGDEATLTSTTCKLAANPVPPGSSSSNLLGADRAPLCPTCSSASPQGVIYRISIRVTGPRNTQSFFQSTFTTPTSS